MRFQLGVGLANIIRRSVSAVVRFGAAAARGAARAQSLSRFHAFSRRFGDGGGPSLGRSGWVGPTPTEEMRGRVREELSQELQAVAAAALSGVVHKTPERTGFAKGNWHVGRNRSSSEMTRRVRGERETVADGERVIAGAEIGDRVHIFNNVPYIDKLERGSSREAPVGMVAVTAASIEAMIR